MDGAPGENPQATGPDRPSAKARKRGKEKPVKRPKVKKEASSVAAGAVGPGDALGDRVELGRPLQHDEQTVRQHPGRPHVLVLKDSGNYPRGCFWEEAFKHLKHDLKVRSLEHPDEFFMEELQQYEVLIVNWDAINGDPSFRADFALRWFEHRHPELRRWVAHGGILIIEGQARLSVPTQAPYDALVGAGQLRVSGPSHPSQAGIEEKRVGKSCCVARRVRPDTPLGKFRGKKLGSQKRTRTFEDMFPGAAGRLLVPLGPTELSKPLSDWNNLYRGWFKPWIPLPFGGWRLQWVTLVETADRKWYERPHATMMAAKYDQGAVFVTTMVLSNINEEDVGFINAILNYHNRVQDLPEPTRISGVVQTHLREVVNLGVAVAFSLGFATGPADSLKPIAKQVLGSPGLEPVARFVLGLVALGAVLALVYSGLWLRRRLIEMFGL